MSKRNFTKLAYDSCDDLIFSLAKYPVILKNGLSIGGGTLYPEINFTLPPMSVEEATMPQVLGIYREIMRVYAQQESGVGFVAEIETLPPMT